MKQEGSGNINRYVNLSLIIITTALSLGVLNYLDKIEFPYFCSAGILGIGLIAWSEARQTKKTYLLNIENQRLKQIGLKEVTDSDDVIDVQSRDV